MNRTSRVSIVPGVSILSVLRHLNYKPWFAMAEFLDNSIQSFLDYRNQLSAAAGGPFRLRVEIELDPSDEGRIVVRDNAAGIHNTDFPRAFRPAEVPPDCAGLCEFGMGMKSAACWFANRWTVRTAALSEGVERTVSFDIRRIVNDRLEELDVSVRPVPRDRHYTEITLEGLHHKLQTRTLGKIKEHLASIYRSFLRDGALELIVAGDQLSYSDPDVLVASYYKTPDAQAERWCKEIDIDLGGGLTAQGFAALLKTASTSRAGFALFRRGRVIEGSGDESYRPEAIFGKPNSYRYQRLFGELTLAGFGISHTKDGFRWEEHEEAFLQALRIQLNAEPVPLLSQAEEYRVRPKPIEVKSAAESAVEHTGDVIEHDVPPVLAGQLQTAPDAQPPPENLSASSPVTEREIRVEMNGCKWLILLELSHDPAVGDWLTVSDRGPVEGSTDRLRCVGVRVSLAHPFMDRFGGADGSHIEPLLRVAAALGLAEIAARDGGARQTGTIRRNVNQLLRDAFSKP